MSQDKNTNELGGKTSDAPVFDVGQIFARYQRQKEAHGQRDNEYDRIDEYLQGRFYDNQRTNTNLRDESRRRNVDGTWQITSNLLSAAVWDAVALEAQMFAIDVPAKSSKASEEGFSKKIQEYLIGTWYSSNVISLMNKSAYNKHAYGFSVIGALPDLAKKRIRFVTYHPRYCYPVFEMGSDVYMRELFVSWMVSPGGLRDKFPSFNTDGLREDEDVEFVQYFSKTHRMTFARNQVLTNIRHDWGFVPFVTVPCMPAAGTIGIGDVHQSVSMVIGMNKLINAGHEAIEATIDNPLVFTGISPEELRQNPPIRYGNKLVYCIPEGKVDRLPPTTGPLPETFELTRYYENLLEATTGFSAARKGQREGAYVSAKGQHALMEPTSGRIDNLKRIEAERLAVVNEYCLRLTEHHFFDTPVEVYGYVGATSFKRKLKGSEIKGHYVNYVNYPPSLFSDMGRKIAEFVQLYQIGAISLYTMMAQLGISDNEFEVGQIEKERTQSNDLEITLLKAKTKAQMEMQSQAMLAQSVAGAPKAPGAIAPGGGGAPPGDAQAAQYALEQGKTSDLGGAPPSPAETAAPSGGVPPSPEVMQAMMAAQAGGAPGPQSPADQMMPNQPIHPEMTAEVVHIEQVADLIRTLPKAWGKIYLVGRIVETGISGQEVEVFLTNMLDRASIVNLVKKGLPVLDGRIQFKPTQGEPSEAFLEVTPGTDGYEVGGVTDGLQQQSPDASLPGASQPGPGVPGNIPSPFGGNA